MGNCFLIDKIKITNRYVHWSFVNQKDSSLALLKLTREDIKNALPFESEYLLPDIIEKNDTVQETVITPDKDNYILNLMRFLQSPDGLFIDMTDKAKRDALKEALIHFAESKPDNSEEYRFVLTAAKIARIKAKDEEEAKEKISDPKIIEEFKYALIDTINRGNYSISELTT